MGGVYSTCAVCTRDESITASPSGISTVRSAKHGQQQQQQQPKQAPTGSTPRNGIALVDLKGEKTRSKSTSSTRTTATTADTGDSPEVDYTGSDASGCTDVCNSHNTSSSSLFDFDEEQQQKITLLGTGALDQTPMRQPKQLISEPEGSNSKSSSGDITIDNAGGRVSATALATSESSPASRAAVYEDAMIAQKHTTVPPKVPPSKLRSSLNLDSLDADNRSTHSLASSSQCSTPNTQASLGPVMHSPVPSTVGSAASRSRCRSTGMSPPRAGPVLSLESETKTRQQTSGQQQQQQKQGKQRPSPLFIDDGDHFSLESLTSQLFIIITNGNLQHFQDFLHRHPMMAHVNSVRFKTMGLTPLHIAVIEDRPDIVEFLLALGADVGIKDETGKSALNYAYFSKNTYLINLLSHVRRADFAASPFSPSAYSVSTRGGDGIATPRNLRSDSLAAAGECTSVVSTRSMVSWGLDDSCGDWNDYAIMSPNSTSGKQRAKLPQLSVLTTDYNCNRNINRAVMSNNHIREYDRPSSTTATTMTGDRDHEHDRNDNNDEVSDNINNDDCDDEQKQDADYVSAQMQDTAESLPSSLPAVVTSLVTAIPIKPRLIRDDYISPPTTPIPDVHSKSVVVNGSTSHSAHVVEVEDALDMIISPIVEAFTEDTTTTAAGTATVDTDPRPSTVHLINSSDNDSVCSTARSNKSHSSSSRGSKMGRHIRKAASKVGRALHLMPAKDKNNSSSSAAVDVSLSSDSSASEDTASSYTYGREANNINLRCEEELDANRESGERKDNKSVGIAL